MTICARPMLLHSLTTLDALLDAHVVALGRDFTAYRNHAYRVANFCVALSANARERVEKIAIAATFHDLGIWTADTFDYLRPSVALARAHLSSVGRLAWQAEIAEMIDQHHKLLPYRHHRYPLVEPFRRADLIDVSRGIISFGLSRGFIREVLSRWPAAGFHQRLVQLAVQRLRTYPRDPLPMLKW